ncbi:sulfotransferase [Mesorhizobium sp. SARCC-RB16n]|uniref:sulfotransferase n=1 Tax=Mesorhizobium sp. SARCC-RB16n TaxID=2116687 RepID=UPI00166B4D2F|nr:sulfotransferase [Mesorhizobium sp. SARCC-RB16n]
MNLTIVVSYGRSGSTIFMRMLRENPAFLIRQVFPYESRTSQYLFAASKVGLPPDLSPVTYQEATYDFAQDGDEAVWDFGRQLNKLKPGDPIAFSRLMLNHVADVEHNTEAVHSVEKGIGVDLAREIAEVRQDVKLIFLIRDPRSIYYSVKSFNKKRGIISFGEEAGDNVLYQRIVQFVQYVRWLSLRTAGRSIVLRYEEMMEHPDLFCRRVLSFYDLPDADDVVEKMTSVVDLYDQSAKDHMTSSPRKDLSRWKSDAKESDLSIFSKWESDLKEIGYE